jgi:Tol biopolymer transport system component
MLGMNVMNVLTGEEKTLGHAFMNSPIPAWSDDSRSVFWSTVEDSLQQGATVVRSLLVTTLDGSRRKARVDTVARSAGLIPGGGGAQIGADGSGDVFVSGAVGHLGGQMIARLGMGYTSLPAFSPDGRRVAFRHNPGGTDNLRMHVLEVMNVDGSQRTTVDLPFAMSPGPNNPSFLADPTKVLVAGRDSRDAETRCYVVDLKSKEITRIKANIAQRRDIFFACQPSPDGKTLLVSTEGETVTTFADVDLSDFAPHVASTRHQR